MTRDFMSRQLAQFDADWQDLNALAQRLENTKDLPVDARGGTLLTDLQTKVLMPANRAQLSTARAAAKREFDGGDWPGVWLALYPAKLELVRIATQFRALIDYWARRPGHDLIVQSWRDMVAANHLPNPRAEELVQFEQKLEAHVAQGQFAETLSEDLPVIDALYALIFIETHAAARGRTLSADPWHREPKVACPATDVDPGALKRPDPAHGAKVILAKSKPADDYYPRWEESLRLFGITTVRVRVTASGCPRWAEIEKSSDAPRIDQAALQYAVDGVAYQPATIGGTAVEGLAIYNVRFTPAQP